MKTMVRRSMLFVNMEDQSAIQFAFEANPDCIIFDLEDAVKRVNKELARRALAAVLTEKNFKEVETWVRINGLDTEFYAEDIFTAVKQGIDGIRIPKTEKASEVLMVEKIIEAAELECGKEVGTTMIMAAIESPLGLLNSFEIAISTDRMMGLALSAGDYKRGVHAKGIRNGVELFYARNCLLVTARAAGVMVFDTVFKGQDDEECFRDETVFIRDLGFDGKSCNAASQVAIVHELFSPSKEEVKFAVQALAEIKENKKIDPSYMIHNGKIVDQAFVDEMNRILLLKE